MLTPRDFVTEEYWNVRDLLDESLRYEYGRAKSKKFFGECSSRLDALWLRVRVVAPTDIKELSTLSNQLSSISALITRIERSRRGEFSWPFANALEKLAKAICDPPKYDKAFGESLFFISSQEGLSAYRIHAEQGNPEFFGNRIFNVVFPRSLKHHVLLHPILGHEIGHAALTVLNMRGALINEVALPLIKKSVFVTAESTKDWLDQNFPLYEGRIDLHTIRTSREKWIEEFVCDLFGLLLMGPSFLGAHLSLLSAIDPGAEKLGKAHPAPACRFWMLGQAMGILGWNKFPYSDPVKTPAQGYWEAIEGRCQNVPAWAKVFDEAQLAQAVQGLLTIMKPRGLALYQLPSSDELAELLEMVHDAIPPIGRPLADGDGFKSKEVDFRTILFAGWLAWYSDPQIRDRKSFGFFRLNRLCDHAILQQEAIATWIAHEKKKEERKAATQ